MNRLSRWNTMHSFILSIAGVSAMITGDVATVYLVGTASFIVLFYIEYPHWKKLRFGGAGNLITLLRLILLMSTYYIPSGRPFLIFAVLLASILLDAIDGWIARQTNSSSNFGAYFDIETDAMFMLILCLQLNKLGYAEPWILNAGLLRYYYVLVKSALKWNHRKEPRINAIRYVAIIVFVLFFSPFFLDTRYHAPMLISGSGILLMSFSYSFYRLARN